MIVTLIGYRGSGKSTIAPLVAKALGWEWTDSDTVIETTAGCSIRDIFAAEGEVGFRHRETSVLATLLAKKNTIIAAGGGAVLAEVNRQRMKCAGPVVWLTARPEVLAGRLVNDESTSVRRPSLTGRPVDEEIREVLEIRIPIYQDAATHTVDTEQLTQDEVVTRIVEIARESSEGRPD